jgi:hypothetical protein
MPPLPNEPRSLLERTVIAARDAAEAAARAALVTLAVERPEPFPTLSEEQKLLRRALRAKARQLGSGSQAEGMPQLIEEIAYQQWHRMLFARFLAENNLLRHPAGVAVTLQDCAELAAEEGAADAWELAARYAALMLPGIFLADDPTSQAPLAPESRHALEKLVQDLAVEVFTADDALGWCYQFWQSRKKDEVNKSERKIGGADLYPVTQLFTEDYMVRFLLENSLGAWWAARHPDSPLIKAFGYLRTLDDGTPAVGTFPGWPARAAEITVMDPCGGSGHFIVAAFDMLRRMRTEEEGLGEAAAADATIRDNLFMLEIDPRCTQIAAFALAFAAWKAGGYRPLPAPNIACSGIAVEGQLDDWLKLANGDSRLRASLERLYNLFRQAPTLGSLIDPAHVPEGERMWSAEYDEVAPFLARALTRERTTDDPARAVTGAAAQDVARAARLLAGRYTLVATNVPYLGFRNQAEALQALIESRYPDAKANLATAFVVRCLNLSYPNCTAALVFPQNWLYQSAYESLRRTLLSTESWNCVALLGVRAFETISGHVVNIALAVISRGAAEAGHLLAASDVSGGERPLAKASLLRTSELHTLTQSSQLRNAEARITLEMLPDVKLLQDFVVAPQGIKTGDDDRWRRCFWELPRLEGGWRFYQSTANDSEPYGGREHVIDWRDGGQQMIRPRLDNQAVGKFGVAIKQIGDLGAALYTGDLYDSNVAPLVPRDPAQLPALWAFCTSPDYREAVRRVDRGWKVSNLPLTQVPFDATYWQSVAQESSPLPEPHSDDPTQWLFAGHLVGSTGPLQVAVARLLGYEWPQQQPDNLSGSGDSGGIVCLPPVAGEQPAAERLRTLLAATYRDEWSLATLQELLAGAGFKDRDLAEWLRDGFFEQHCRLFHNRPFIWHIWDGRKDGFSALVNYHKLNAANLDKLIYTYLGNWIETQRAEAGRGVAGADGRLVAALELKKKLELIRDGEPPYDIYVRWKPLAEQPIGWNPDLNDGVRLNIRPFVTAGVLRSKFTINWNKDRGKNPDGSERLNDLHFTHAEKIAARRGRT